MIDIPDAVFPTNDQGQAICPKCRRVVKECTCPVWEPATPKPAAGDRGFGNVYIRLEKSGRSGKTVTVIRRLAVEEKFLSELERALKKKTGSGGTHYVEEDGGTIEIQGDKEKAVREFFKKGTG
jgi:translation initiation factor 1